MDKVFQLLRLKAKAEVLHKHSSGVCDILLRAQCQGMMCMCYIVRVHDVIMCVLCMYK